MDSKLLAPKPAAIPPPAEKPLPTPTTGVPYRDKQVGGGEVKDGYPASGFSGNLLANLTNRERLIVEICCTMMRQMQAH